MYWFRFITVILGFLFAVLVSFLSGIELFKVFALMSFLLVIDTITVRYLSNLYMQAVYKEMEKEQIDNMKNSERDNK